MRIKDIVNRDLVNLQNCESEPIHIPGSIQPHGFLIAIKEETQQIEFCSGNVIDFIGIRPEQLLGMSIDALVGDNQSISLSQYLKRRATYADAPLRITINETPLECVSHVSGDVIILEFEPQGEDSTDSHELYYQTRQFINNIETSNTLKSLCQHVADEIRKITAYDRVMVYRFDEQYNGEVFAESLNDNIEPFLGLHYPHTDIPVQARELYIKNLLRVIVDLNYKPVPILTLDDGREKNLDMSFTSLRSVSPIHVQYLQNMGVGATLTISLVHEQKLWGLIACHHYSPKYLTNALKVSAKLQGHFLTSQIKVREANEEYIVSKDVDRDLQALIHEDLPAHRDSLTELVSKTELLDICHASGVAIAIDEQMYKAGAVPDDQDLKDLLEWLGNRSTAFFATDKLSSVYPKGEDLAEIAAGIVYHSLGTNHNAVVWFRHETRKEVNWGGDPQKAILKDEKGLHPRKSFASWKEIVKGKSNPWLKPELSAAANFTHFLQRQVHLLFITEEESRYRTLSQKLQEANAELENINYISAHDLKEPLRKIQVFASRILDSDVELPDNVMYNVTRMSAAAQRMQALIYDILSYARINRIKDAMVSVDLNAVITDAIDELSEELQEKKASVNCETLPVIHGISFLLHQLFLNLMRNSLKFSTKDVSPEIRIRYTAQPVRIEALPEKLFHEISLIDNGIGFGNEFKESIFDVFTRLHHHEKYSGSGVGLALCKKIMQNHEGMITADGKEGKGATFKLYFPIPS